MDIDFESGKAILRCLFWNARPIGKPGTCLGRGCATLMTVNQWTTGCKSKPRPAITAGLGGGG
jgi:hypothetical protein